MSRYTKALAQSLQLELGITESLADRVLDHIAYSAILHATFKGAINTPFGKVAMTSNGLQIVEQNPELLSQIASETSLGALEAKVSAFIAGGE